VYATTVAVRVSTGSARVGRRANIDVVEEWEDGKQGCISIESESITPNGFYLKNH